MCAKTLMSFGANVNALNARHQTPLDLATIAWASQERETKVINHSNSVEAVKSDPVQIRLSVSEGDEEVKEKLPVEEVKEMLPVAASPEVAQQLHDMLDLFYSVGALRGKSRKLRFNKIPKIVDSNDFSSESGLERSIKLRDYDEGGTVLSLYEELEDYINRRIDGQLSLSMNPDEAIAMTYQQQEMYRYKKTCKELQPGIGFEVRGRPGRIVPHLSIVAKNTGVPW